jgi:hypothetical protein
MHIIQQPITSKQQFYWYFFVGIALLIFWPAYLFYLSPITFPLDDAYIVLHNAQVLHLGHDNNYLGVPALVGSTSIVHTLLVSLLIFWLTPIHALLIIQWLSIVLYVFGLLRLTMLFKITGWQTLLFLIAGLAMGYLPYHLLSGMETVLAMAGVTWSLVLSNQQITRTQRVWLALLCGVLPFLRPELALWSVLLLFYQIYRYKKFGINKSHIFSDGLLVLIVAVPCLVIYYLNTGYLLPTTLKAKLVYYAFATLPFGIKIIQAKDRLLALAYQTSYLGCLGMLCFLWLSFFGRLALIFILFFLSFYIYYFSVGIDFNYWRYIYIIWPLLLYGLLQGLTYQEKILKIGANILLLFMMVQVLWTWPQHWQAYMLSRGYTLNELAGVAQWLKKNISSRTTLLVHDAGYVAFATSFQMIDLVGLKTPSSIYYNEKFSLEIGTSMIENKIQNNEDVPIEHLRAFRGTFGKMYL